MYPSVVGSTEASASSADTLWGYVESLSVFTADVALAVLAQMCEPSVGDRPKFPLLQPVQIKAHDILRYKGIQRRGGERRALLRRIHDEMERLRGLKFDVECFGTVDPTTGRSESVSWRGDRLFDIVRLEVIQETLLGETRDIEVAWQVRAGQWAYSWLSPQARVWVGKMARALLELDHRDNRGPAVLAKKLGQRVLLLYHALRRKNPLKLSIRNLLTDIGELPQPQARDAHWAGKTRDNFEQAMLRLGPGDSLTDGVSIFQKVEWPEGHGPDDSDRCKGWPERWLSASVSITMPDSPQRALEATTEVKPGRARWRRASKSFREEKIGPTVREARLNRETPWTQQKLAKHLRIASTYLSLIECGQRRPSKELASRMGNWLKSRERERQ